MKVDPLLEVRKRKRLEQAQELIMSGELDAARDIYQGLLSQDEKNPGAMRGMGLLHVQLGELPTAEKWLRAAIEVRSTDYVAWNDLGEVLRMQGKGSEAIDAYTQSLKLEPAFVEAMNNLAVALAGAGEIEEAKKTLRAAIEIAPDDPHPYNNLGVLLECEGNHEAALMQYERAVMLKPDFAEAKENFATLLAYQPERILQSMDRLLEDARNL